MNVPTVIVTHSFQEAWARAVINLKSSCWRTWNLVVQIDTPSVVDLDIQDYGVLGKNPDPACIR